jgi:hypothetical protein
MANFVQVLYRTFLNILRSMVVGCRYGCKSYATVVVGPNFSGYLFGCYAVEGEHLFTLQALCLVFFRDDQHSLARWTGGWKRALPTREIAFGIIGAAVENTAFSRSSLDHLAAIVGASHTDLLQPGLRMPAGWEIAA